MLRAVAMQIARNIRIDGLVQGVGFREWAATIARGLGLTGWVRNRRDGSVEAIVVGQAGSVERFISKLRQGPPGSRVDRVRVDEAPVKPFDGFQKVATA
jgi:acylphosphatase